MINKLDQTLNFHQMALNIRASRQEILSSNVANSDTPNYKARDLDFSDLLQNILTSESGFADMTTTSPKHIRSSAQNTMASHALYRVPLQPSVDGNTVDMNMERSQFADNAIMFDASLTFVSNQIQMMMSAIQER